ncbi:DUF559 domain-containing protein [Rhizobium leguminosarum]|uniref:DUF559 domain-containing protein n=1 Tax=Rhizobium leguminosarum TaxID=384 RepID=UPI0039658661
MNLTSRKGGRAKTGQARRLRRNETEEEYRLWGNLRDRRLNGAGYSVLRFWNHEITKERRAVLETILAALERRIFQRDDILRFYPAIVRPEDVKP